jgi:predicted dehydrogenase
MADLQVCLLGAGMLGEVHAQSWVACPGARLVAIADPIRERAEALAAQIGAQPYTDWHEALARPGLDAVSVVVPSGYHRECTVAALEQGLHVLCEKPLAVTLEDALAIKAAAEASDRKVALGFCKRFMGQVLKTSELVAAGALGRPLMYRHVSGLEVRHKPWIMDRRLGGGPIVDILCHYIDQCRVIYGSDPCRVKASGMHFSAGSPLLPEGESQLDTFSMTTEYASGDVLAVSMTWGLATGMATEVLEDCLGPKGMLKIRGNDITLLQGGGRTTEFKNLPCDMYDLQIAAFADAIRRDAPVAAGVEDGLVALRVSLAVIESITTGQAVEL